MATPEPAGAAALRRRHRRRDALGALALGAASVAAFAPLGAFALAWLTFAGLFALLCRAETPRDGALVGAAFGFGLLVTGVSWVYVSLSVFGGMPAALAGFATLAFCAGLSIYPALVGTLFVRFAPRCAAMRGLYFAALWTLSEWLRGWVLTGFPWLALGYSQTPPSPLAGIAPVAGVFGVSLATAWLASLLAQGFGAWRAAGWRPAAPSLLAAIALLAGGAALRSAAWTTPVGDALSVSLLQGNVAQDIKWRREGFAQSLRSYYELARDNPAQLTVLPEAAFPVFREQLPADYLDALQRAAAPHGGDLLFGVVHGSPAAYTNAAVSIGRSGEQIYRKSHLVPFGEFVPKGFAWFLALAHIPMSQFTAGAARQPLLALAGQRVAVNICYEDAFGEEIIRALPAATLLVNLSNVAWFGDSLAPPQHLQIARLRSLESGRMMLRATNTGMTAVIGVDGEVQAVLPAYTRAALRAEVRGYAGTTPYVRAGNWPVVVGCTAIVLGVLLRALRGRRKALC